MVQNVGCLKENTYLCNRKSEMNALLAQLVEQLTLNQWVQGSNPSGGKIDVDSQIITHLVSF